MEATASAFALAEVARRTALLIGRVYSAQRDAEALIQKIRNLSHLLDHIDRALKKRQATSQGFATEEENEPPIIQFLTGSLATCKTTLDEMYERFTSLVDKGSGSSRAQFFHRLRFVRSEDYITARESDITMHLSHLSLAFQCLMHEDVQDLRRQGRESATRDQPSAQAASFSQLLALLAYAVQHHPAISSSLTTTTLNVSSAAGSPTQTLDAAQTSAGDGNNLIFGNQPPTNNLQRQLGSVNDDDDLRSLYGAYFFGADREATEGEENETIETDQADPTFNSEDTVRQEFDALDRNQSVALPQFTIDRTLLLAIVQGNKELVKNLITEGANAILRDSHDWTILHHATFCQHVEVVKVILNHDNLKPHLPEVLNAQTNMGETALLRAVKRISKPEAFDITMLLLNEETCDVNISDLNPNEGLGTALCYAIKEGKPSKPRIALVKILVDKGADIVSVYESYPDHARNYDYLMERLGDREHQ